MAVSPKRALSYLGAAKQTVQGTGAAPSRFFVLRRQAFLPSQEIAEFRTGGQRDLSIFVKEKFLYAGAFQTFLYANEGGALLAWAMGADALSGVADPYTHTLTLADNLPYQTYEAAFYETSIIDRVIDSKIAKLLIEAEATKEVMLTANLLGSSVAVQASAATPTFSNGAGEGPMTFYHGAMTLTGPSDAATLQGQIQKFSIEIDHDSSPEYGSSLSPIAIVEQGRKVTFKMTAIYTFDPLHRLTHYGSSTGSAVSEIVATGSFAVTLTSQAASPGPERSVLLSCPLLKWTMSKPEFDADGKLGKIEAEATAYRSGATMPLSAVVKNGVSAAYI
jgi:hypothetical protein